MLRKDSEQRPIAEDLLRRLSACDMGKAKTSTPSIFGDCCRAALMPVRQHVIEIANLKQYTKVLETDHEKALTRALESRALQIERLEVSWITQNVRVATYWSSYKNNICKAR